MRDGLQPGEVISYMEMCSAIGVNLQRGMNFRLKDCESIILMSLRPGAPYADRVEDEGRTLIYEGQDVARTADAPYPKKVDQPDRNPGGSLTQNGLFARRDQECPVGQSPPPAVPRLEPHFIHDAAGGEQQRKGGEEVIHARTHPCAGDKQSGAGSPQPQKSQPISSVWSCKFPEPQ